MIAVELSHDETVRRIALVMTAERLYARCVDGPGNCLIWTGCKNSRGYGVISHRGARVLTHRIAYDLYHENEPAPNDMTIDHLCKNKLCVNADHLELVTRAENSRRGSLNTGKSRCKRGHALIGDNLIVKKRGAGRTPVRNCRTCQQDAALARRYSGWKPEAEAAS